MPIFGHNFRQALELFLTEPIASLILFGKFGEPFSIESCEALSYRDWETYFQSQNQRQTRNPVNYRLLAKKN